MATLEIRGLNKSFPHGREQRQVLRDIELTLHDNEFVSLVGTSGCGKSTLLSIAAGLEGFDSGQVLVDGEPIRGAGLDRGVVFQSYTLLPWLNARENIEFALKAAGRTRGECRRIADEHLQLVGLNSYRPKILLMDEPFGALDAMTRHQMQELLTRIWEHHRLTVMFVTHDIEEAVYLSDRIVVMGRGPGHIKASFPVELGRPRHEEMATSTAFIALQRQVLKAIREDERQP